MRYFACTSSIAILALSSFPADAAEPTGPDRDKLSANLTVEVDGPLLAGLPLQLKLTIINTGKAPLDFRNDEGAMYPDASHFVAAITDASGHTRRYRLHNQRELTFTGRGRLWMGWAFGGCGMGSGCQISGSSGGSVLETVES